MMRTGIAAAVLLVLSAWAPSARAEKVVAVVGEAGKDTIIEPFDVDFDPEGRMVFVEFAGKRVRRVEKDGSITTLGGTARTAGKTGDGGPAKDALFDGLHSLAVAPNGDIYLADTWNHKVRKIEAATGKVVTVAGTGKGGYSGDGGPADKADFHDAYAIALDAKAERLYIADLRNYRVRMVTLADGLVTTVAGNGKKGVPEDGQPAVEQPLADPRAVAVSPDGKLYIVDRGGHALRVVGPGGKIRTVVNTSGKGGPSGNGGDAAAVKMNGPKHVRVAKDGSVLICDTENDVILRYLPGENKVVRLAGTGKRGSAGLDGPPSDIQLKRPHGTGQDRDGTIYIADSENNRILKIVP
jgi:DNA-binding beta-propeller fold protein YncE